MNWLYSEGKRQRPAKYAQNVAAPQQSGCAGLRQETIPFKSKRAVPVHVTRRKWEKKREEQAAQTWHIVDEGHEQGKVPVAEQRKMGQGMSKGMYTMQSRGSAQARGSTCCTTEDGVSEGAGELKLCRPGAAWHTLPARCCGELSDAAHGVGRQACSKGQDTMLSAHELRVQCWQRQDTA